MTLLELSVDYRASAAALRERTALLKQQLEQSRDEAERLMLTDRIRTLGIMWRETRDLAVLCEHYYDRGYAIERAAPTPPIWRSTPGPWRPTIPPR